MASWLERPVIVLMAALLAGAVVALVIERRDGPEPLEISLPDLTPTAGGPIQVYITGAVVHPGVYELKDGDRAVDALFAAGGAAPDADLESVNLAVRLHDEDRLLVPRQGQTASASAPSGVTSNVAGVSTAKINLNTATAGELDALPGIGEVYSQRIVDSRTRDGLFAAPDELLARDIIPQATFERIQDLISVGP